MSKTRLLPGLIAIAGLLIAAPALAETWKWRDASGRVVYSDQPPPPEVRASQILRGPRSATPADAASAPSGDGAGQPAEPAAAAGGTPAEPGTAAAPSTWVEKEQAFRKRKLEREEAAKKDREQREQAARTARACDEARSALRTLESGLRMAVVKADGEREVLDDRERARRIDHLRQEIARGCGKPG